MSRSRRRCLRAGCRTGRRAASAVVDDPDGVGAALVEEGRRRPDQAGAADDDRPDRRLLGDDGVQGDQTVLGRVEQVGSDVVDHFEVGRELDARWTGPVAAAGSAGRGMPSGCPRSRRAVRPPLERLAAEPMAEGGSAGPNALTRRSMSSSACCSSKAPWVWSRGITAPADSASPEGFVHDEVQGTRFAEDGRRQDPRHHVVGDVRRSAPPAAACPRARHRRRRERSR